MRRIKNWAMAVGLNRFLLMWAVIGLGCALPSAAQAGGYTTYIINMAKLNYKTPVYYSQVFRSSNAADVYTSSNACLQNISQRVSQNKRNGWDYECYLIIYTERDPARYLPSGGGTLANIAGGAGGKWAGWIIYWTPALNKGSYLNPYSNFKPYGPSAAPAAKGAPATLAAPIGKATNTPAVAPTIPRDASVSQIRHLRSLPSGASTPGHGRDIFVGKIGTQRFKVMRSVARTSIAVNDGKFARNSVYHRGGSGFSSHQVRQEKATETGSAAC